MSWLFRMACPYGLSWCSCRATQLLIQPQREENGLTSCADRPALNSDARAASVDARALKREARTLAQQAQNEPNMTNADRAEFGLTLRDTEPTLAPVPDSFPIVTIDTSKRLRHALRWSDNKTPTSRARPEGMDYAEIWLYVGTQPPTGPSQFHLIDTATKNSYNYEYTETDAGKTAYFILRWVNSRCDKGPWSETVSATITG